MPQADLIRELYTGLKDGYLYIYELPSKKTTWYLVSDIEKFIADVVSKKGGNVYMGLCPSGILKTSHQRATNADVCAQTAIVVDIDIKKEGAHSQTALPNTEEEAQAWLKELSLPEPSAITHTGNGLRVYWLLDKPFLITYDAARSQAKELSYGINRFLISEGKKRGWKFDNIGDLARIVRVVGTFNHKTNPPKPVRILGMSAKRYSFEELESFIPPVDANESMPIDFSHIGDDGIKSNAKANFASVEAGCRFVQHCIRNTKDLSETEWYRLLSIAARCKDGKQICHELSRNYDKYTREETSTKIDQALNATGPATCAYTAKDLGFEGCMACPLYHAGKLKSPVIPPFLVRIIRLVLRGVFHVLTEVPPNIWTVT